VERSGDAHALDLMRYYLIDKVTELERGVRARGVKCVTLTDEVLHDHFPDFPTFPGALIVESAAQLAGFLLELTFNGEEQPLVRALLMQIERAKFYDLVGPGETLELTVTLASSRESSAQVTFEATTRGKRAARGTLTFVLREIASARVHEQRRYVYGLWTRDFDPPLVLP
jgi:3-hydroxymyristoyl/3-hydroxydecanoyl-(acyl carrier protein) dehydratase